MVASHIYSKMPSPRLPLELLLLLTIFPRNVFTGPGVWIEIDNGTPYDWKLVASHQYQMEWKPAEVIEAGRSRFLLVIHLVINDYEELLTSNTPSTGIIGKMAVTVVLRLPTPS